MENGSGALFLPGDKTLGGKRNLNPYGTSLLGSARRSKPGEHELPVKPLRQ